MSGQETYPPPGSPPPGPAVPAASYPAPPAWQSPVLLGAAHKPGAIPLRPLGLGDLFDGAVRIIRHSPKATAGVAVLVTAASAALTLLTVAALLALGATFTESSAFSGAESESTTEAFGGTAQFLSTSVLPLLLQSLGTLVVSGMVAHVVLAAATGRRISVGEAWAATRGRRWRLVGLTLLLGLLTVLLVGAYVAAWVGVVVVGESLVLGVLFGLVSVPLFIVGMFWFWIRVYYLPVPALMLEDVGVLGAIRRGYGLTRRAFWRTCGIALLTWLVVVVASVLLAIPFTVVGEIAAAVLDGSPGVLATEAAASLGTIVASAFATPFAAAVTTLQYVDLRMRREAYDVELMTRAGVVEP